MLGGTAGPQWYEGPVGVEPCAVERVGPMGSGPVAPTGPDRVDGPLGWTR
jgi:hypothetical protein